MKRLLCTLLVIGMAAAALTGCKASAGVEPNGAARVAPAR